MITLSTTINGEMQSTDIEERTFLLDYLRDELGLTGAKRSCDVQVCGTCTVLVEDKPVSACSLLAYEVQGKKVLTIEGLSDLNSIHPIQQAFLDEYGLQCGYCTPGMVMSTFALLKENSDPDDNMIRGYLRGNLCRCTGYYPIIKAVKRASETMHSELG